MEFVQAPEDPARLVGSLLADRQLSCSFLGSDPAQVPRCALELTEDDEQVSVALREQAEHQDFRTLAGHDRWARGRLRLPLGERRLVDEAGRLLPVARQEALLVPPAPWSLLAYEYSRSHAAPRWTSLYARRGGSLRITQGGADLLHVDWERDAFRPLLLAEPEVGGRQGILHTFSGEEGTNHVLAWRTSTAAVLVQRTGPAAPDELLALASALGDVPASPGGSDPESTRRAGQASGR